jgi:hypothetical protein
MAGQQCALVHDNGRRLVRHGADDSVRVRCSRLWHRDYLGRNLVTAEEAGVQDYAGLSDEVGSCDQAAVRSPGVRPAMARDVNRSLLS